MRHALSLYFEREAQGLKTVFLVRNRLIPFEEVRRYFRRKGVKDLRSFACNHDATTPTTAISCRTPEPENAAPEISNIARQPGGNRQNTTGDLADLSVIAVSPDPGRMDRSLQLPAKFHILQQVLHYSREHDEVLIPPWELHHHATAQYQALTKFLTHYFKGQRQLALSLRTATSTSGAFVSLDSAFDSIRDLITTRECGALLLPLMTAILGIGNDPCQLKIMSQLICFVADMPQLSARRCQPLVKALAGIGKLLSDWPECSDDLNGALISHFENTSAYARPGRPWGWTRWRFIIPPDKESGVGNLGQNIASETECILRIHGRIRETRWSLDTIVRLKSRQRIGRTGALGPWGLRQPRDGVMGY